VRLGNDGYPLIILSHRRREFIEQALLSLRHYGEGITEVVIVDDSGDLAHHDYLDRRNIGYSLSEPAGRNCGYLGAMQTVFEVGRDLADRNDTAHVMLWEEDFVLTRPTSLRNMAKVMDHPDNAALAQLNLQRQAVYRIERRFGYMESHDRRGYALERGLTGDQPWVRRKRPFTTNPGLIRREVLETDWPSRTECGTDAEGAMSKRLENAGWHFGWYGAWNTPSTRHVGTDRKTGKGY